ncbi:ATP-dependent nuclease [Methanosarcina sp. Mfa9]|uniref:ATP-dependent nuclease n=1 Tax=Methanosarcina sp. Mfa9 TaxID=3439063 RepID=UPI003F85A3E4
MKIEKINIENYKCYYGKFPLELNPCVNILVGNNESGKSTILEAINLALTGILNGRYLKNELSQYLFNHQAVSEYLKSISDDNLDAQAPPSICIEIFFERPDLPRFEGNGNSERTNACGVSMKIEFDPEYQNEYEELIEVGEIKSIPIEYYRISWQSFARESVTARSIPMKSVLIDSSSSRYQNGSDVYISRIIHADLEDSDKAAISQEYRKMKEMFGEADSVKAINEKITTKSKITDKDLSISVDLATHNSWETTLMTYLDEIPFHHIGKGEQCIIKTNLALGHKKSQEANLILLEEPESHLSHTKLNQLLRSIEDECEEKQVIISTHSSFVANKLGIENLILLNERQSSKLTELPGDTLKFFKKLPGYQTLRLLLCRKAVLVEGDSDELIFQKAYMDANEGKLPIEDGIDVISVGLTFKRFLEIAKRINQPVAVITDNDSDYDTCIIEKYIDFEDIECISIFADDRNELRTLEPQFVEANSNDLSALCATIKINSSSYNTEEKISKYMINNKTKWALCVFESDTKLNYPKYIEDAVKWCNE